MLITQLLILNKGSNNHFVLQEQAAALLNLNETHTGELSFKASPHEEDGLRSGCLLGEKPPSSLPPLPSLQQVCSRLSPRSSQDGSS